MLKLVVGLISLILVLTLIVGSVFVIREIGEVGDSLSSTLNDGTDGGTDGGTDSGTNSGTDNGTNSGTDSGTQTPSTADFYIDTVNDTGYRTVAGVTYFFKVIRQDYIGNRCCYFSYYDGSGGNIKPYGSYSLSLFWSTDSIAWSNCMSDVDNQCWQFVSSDTNIGYLCYTTVFGCTNPKVVLEDLNQNVFLNPDIFRYSMVFAAG